jgi:hypothetical protein
MPLDVLKHTVLQGPEISRRGTPERLSAHVTGEHAHCHSDLSKIALVGSAVCRDRVFVSGAYMQYASTNGADCHVRPDLAGVRHYTRQPGYEPL